MQEIFMSFIVHIHGILMTVHDLYMPVVHEYESFGVDHLLWSLDSNWDLVQSSHELRWLG